MLVLCGYAVQPSRSLNTGDESDDTELEDSNDDDDIDTDSEDNTEVVAVQMRLKQVSAGAHG